MKFKIDEIKSGIFRITEPFYKEHANLYLLKGESHDLLLDAGLGVLDLKRFLVEQGFNPRVLVTHAHFDHLGGLIHFRAEEIILLPKVKVNLMDPKLWGLDYCSVDDFAEDYDLEALKNQWLEIPVLVKNTPVFNRQKISCGNRELEIISTQGHSDDSCVLYESSEKLLFSADVLYRGRPLSDLPNSNKRDFVASLESLEALDFEVVLPGHNEILSREKAFRVKEEWLKEFRDN